MGNHRFQKSIQSILKNFLIIKLYLGGLNNLLVIRDYFFIFADHVILYVYYLLFSIYN
jgi:hypothetical protein